jgi:uncharacterized membrane protein
MKRINSIDFTRGFVMIIMALDHVRDMMHVQSIVQNPTGLQTTTPVLFFTRWITYLCAPTFVFLAGTSAYISLRNNSNIAQNRQALLTRGIYLVLLEFVVVNFILFFDPAYHTLIFEVIASTGFGFIILSLLLRQPAKTIGIIGLVIICCHNLVPLIPLSGTSAFGKVIRILFAPGAFPISDKVFIMAYPPIPWLGIILVGFAAGKLFEKEDAQRKKIFWNIGSGSLLLFLVIRFINIYGDTVRWSSQKSMVFSFLSFMNVTKYPPSLVFCLVTLGIMFLILGAADGIKNKFTNIISVYGKVPLFYFLAHFIIVHSVMLVIMMIQGFSWSQLDFASGSFGRPKGVESGLSLSGIYMIWAAIVVVLYWPCKWFGQYKAEHKHWWLKYL